MQSELKTAPTIQRSAAGNRAPLVFSDDVLRLCSGRCRLYVTGPRSSRTAKRASINRSTEGSECHEGTGGARNAPLFLGNIVSRRFKYRWLILALFGFSGMAVIVALSVVYSNKWRHFRFPTFLARTWCRSRSLSSSRPNKLICLKPVFDPSQQTVPMLFFIPVDVGHAPKMIREPVNHINGFPAAYETLLLARQEHLPISLNIKCWTFLS